MLSDVIVALATPPGRSAVALLRLSGSRAFDVAARVLAPFAVDPPRVARRARAVHPTRGERLDDALYLTYRAPASYTGENVVEISTHGGVLVPAEVLAALLAAGARRAAPGEFTRRALQHGKVDLLQAEAVGDLVDATAPAQRRSALAQLDRGLSGRIAELRQRVLDLEALVCYEIDFPEEDDGPVAPERIDAAVREVDARLDALLRGATEGERLREGALAVVAGRPNVGKSSLFNALLGVERAIVTDVPGTTRDAIEAPVVCDGFPFRLVDTAGLREQAESVERLGIEVSRRYLAAADVVLFCAEAGRALTAEERAFVGSADRPLLLVRTKTDVGGASVEGDALGVSARSGEGLDGLRHALARMAFAGLVAAGADLEPLVTRERQREALARARREVESFARTRAAGLETVVAATHLRAAVSALEDVIGLVTTDDVLDRVFGTFCVGK